MSWTKNPRNLFALLAAILAFVAVVYPYIYTNVLTQTGWTLVQQTSSVGSSVQLSYPYTLFAPSQYFSSGTSIQVNVTYVASCASNSGCSVAPEVCTFTVNGFSNIDWGKPIEGQAIDCEGSQSYTYSSATNQYTILFTTIVPESTNYDFVSRLNTPCQSYQCPQYSTPTLTLKQASSVNPLQQYSYLNPQTVQVGCGIPAGIFTILAIYIHRRD